MTESAATNAIELVPSDLIGYIDAIQVAPEFIELQGWVIRRDGSAVEPTITITINGKSFPGFGLGMRKDLVRIGAADGMAGINAIIPIANAPLDAEFQIKINDMSGAVCVVTCPPARVFYFAPRGYIEWLDAGHVRGWVFDPRLLYTLDAPQLFFRHEKIASIYLTIERPDLIFDLGDGFKTFGYEVPTDLVRQEMIRQGLRPGQTGLLALASSGYELSTIQVGLEHGNVVFSDPATSLLPRTRTPASDILERLALLDKVSVPA